MNKPILFILVVGLLFLAGCTSNQETETTTTTTIIEEITTTTEATTTTTIITTTTTTTTTSTTTTTTQAPPQTIIINITATSFKPVDTRINRGDTVVWINTDKSPHTVTSEYGGELDSGGIQRGANYSHEFDAVGIYSYQCNLHPKLKGRVVVVEKDADKPVAQTPINNSLIPVKPNKPVAY